MAAGRWRRVPARTRPRFSARPFVVSTAVVLTLAAVHGLGRMFASDSRLIQPLTRRLVETDTTPCRMVHQAADQCAFVRAHCHDETAGLLPYLSLYYCTLNRALQPAGFAILVVWLGLLFTTIGIAASDFFSVNLGTISGLLGLSESLAGVTFLALGNGSPDVFSTFAAMGSNSGSMAVGELIGAASFITAVVAGSMALVREFRVSRYTFVRDICFFIAAVAFAIVFLADGRLLLWECCTMIAFYLFYVVTVVGWHWVVKRRKRRRVREALLRDGASPESGESYRDESEGENNGMNTSTNNSTNTPPMSPRDVNERGPRIEINSVAAPLEESLDAHQHQHHHHTHSHHHHHLDDDDDERNRHINAEMTSSMRVNRPRGRRSTTVTPIRPSLLGALEFRSVLSSLQRSGTVHLAPIDRRRASAQAGIPTGGSGYGFGVSAHHASGSSSAILPTRRSFLEPPFSFAGSGRGRALSSGDVPRSFQPASTADDMIGQQTYAIDGSSASASASASASTSASPSITVSASVSPENSSETDAPPLVLPEPSASSSSQAYPRPGLPSLHLHIPTTTSHHNHGSPRSSPSLSPFPGYADSPSMLSPTRPSRRSSFGLSTPVSEHYHAHHHAHGHSSYFPVQAPSDVDDSNSQRTVLPKPLRWWPYGVLPPPHIILCTLFPTLQRWREKSVWDKFVSLISVPTVFLLVITLPVVEMEEELEGEGEDEDEDEAEAEADDDIERRGQQDSHSSPYRDDVRSLSDAGSPALVVPEETEWQRYRRSTSVSYVRRPSRELALPPPILQTAEELEQDAAGSSSPGEQTVPMAGGMGGMTKPQIGTGLVGLLTKPQTAASVEQDSVDGGSVATNKATAAEEEAEAAESSTGTWNRWLVAVQLFAGPQFTVLVVWANTEDDSGGLPWMMLAALVTSLGMLGLLLWRTTAEERPRRHALLCFLGFVISVAWISTVAGEVVGVLKAFGVVAGISEAVLGLTIFAVGNSLGDLVADITVARLGYPVMALSACFGGPMLNILLGVGIGGAWMTTRSATTTNAGMATRTHAHTDAYEIEVGESLMVSAITVLVTLVTLLVVVPANGWMMSRRIGIVLICMWVVSTTVNVATEVAGGWAKT
ncbi:sodium calcium exchanger protein [Grosmannia clavigera kw1407]|uniref:Sodium calcium exchanger protein n=1 Tax=Grosmannia clavigera (strain kw1407 / UAMH 11150) TaxID=655863 RepID=F0XKS0_GROCL|nr:sodium calcium exchanger protein [Grosmannia clavigera kw1407]EFX01753.1 sodium calcium exchanger protein [Grosmannia clavigera kw1407]